MQLHPIKSIADYEFTTLKIAGKWTMEGIAGRYENGVTIFEMPYDPGKREVMVKRIP